LPFFGIQDHHSIDTVCQNEGEPGDDAQAENEEQNRAKNNFCASGTPAMVTKKTFEELQKRVDKLVTDTAGNPQPFTYGSHAKLPPDRGAIRADGFYTTTEGDKVHEGSLVRAIVWLVHGAYSNTGQGEGVNCNITGVANNDMHLVLSQTKPTASLNECSTFAAEVTPHFRPEDWLILAKLHKTTTKSAMQKIKDEDLDRPFRITGQMFFDGSHTPCKNGAGSPKRISVWEIHPVYTIDVCKKKTISNCRFSVAGDWKPLHEWLQEQSADEEK